jgi:hypothetical protein
MAVINYDDYSGSNDDYQWWIPVPQDQPTTTINYFWYTTCPLCQGWIWNYQMYHYCPYCGKNLFPVVDKKTEILERLDKILKEIEEIKKQIA